MVEQITGPIIINENTCNDHQSFLSLKAQASW